METPPVAFILRYVLHNWADKYATRILQNLVPAMRKGAKLLIYEYVLEDGPVTDITSRFGFQMDAIMATIFNAQERTAAEYERVLRGADPRYVVEAVRRPEGSTMSIVEVGWTGCSSLDVKDDSRLCCSIAAQESNSLQWKRAIHQ
ncbi:hypothetical protein NUW58_g7920 [Xylaria curta]|uniref:Uncharacterized protein n=1 Tax=Xylaria curta TaxID=42375 RepID=A0ACC1NE45_9PEZI|nr:hypothetical protein NUW58_g7920 [Xylaria curta]